MGSPVPAGAGRVAQIRRGYERKVGLVPAKRVARELSEVLEGRKALQRAAEALARAAAPYSGDSNVAAALKSLREALEG